MNIILLKKKTVKTKKRQKQQPKYWPQDFVNKPKSLRTLIDEKLSQWHDDEWEAGKDW